MSFVISVEQRVGHSQGYWKLWALLSSVLCSVRGASILSEAALVSVLRELISTETLPLDQAGLKLTAIHLSLPPECWD